MPYLAMRKCWVIKAGSLNRGELQKSACLVQTITVLRVRFYYQNHFTSSHQYCHVRSPWSPRVDSSVLRCNSHSYLSGLTSAEPASGAVRLPPLMLSSCTQLPPLGQPHCLHAVTQTCSYTCVSSPPHLFLPLHFLCPIFCLQYRPI